MDPDDRIHRRPLLPDHATASSAAAVETPSSSALPQTAEPIIRECCTYEYSNLTLGPFPKGVECEILSAKYGVSSDPYDSRADVTDYVRSCWSIPSLAPTVRTLGLTPSRGGGS